MHSLIRGLKHLGNLNENPSLIQLRNRIVTPIGRFVARSGLTATVFNFVGLAFGISASVFIAMGNFSAGIVFLVLSGLGDLLDGTVARATGTVSDFGAFLDSTLDRYVDTLIFLGISLYYVGIGDVRMTVVTYFALLGAVVTSYTAARAGSLGVSRYIGFMGRPERVILLLIGIGFPTSLSVVIWILAVLGNITAIHRSAVYLTILKDKNK